MTGEEQLQQYFKRLREDFRFFLKETWRLKPPPVLPEPHWVQYDMAYWLQTGPPRRGIRGARGLSKTWITCAYCCFRLNRNPKREKIVECSATPKNSKESLHMIRVWIEYIPSLKHLIPRDDDLWRDSAESIDVGPCYPEKAPSLTAMGILGALPGTRTTLAIGDDVEQDNNTQTRAARYLLDRRSEELENITLEGGDVVYLGTDHHEESLYEKLEDKGYKFRSWPVRYPTAAEADRIPGLAPTIVSRLEQGINKPGDPLWPERWDEEYIALKELGGKHSFQMQHMLIRGLADGEMYPLKLSDLIFFDALHKDNAPSTIAWGQHDHVGSTAIEDIPSVGFGNDQFYRPAMIDERWLPYQGCKAYLDPAGKGEDEMAWSIIAQLHGYLYWKYTLGIKGGATQENLEKIVLSLREHGARELWIETNFGGEFLIPLIEPIIRRHVIVPDDNPETPDGWSCSVHGVHSSGMKESRILDALAPVMQAHRLVVSRQVASDQKTMYQLTRMKRERGCLEHDDRIESAGGAVAQFKDFLHQDAFTVVRAQKRRAREEKVKKLYQLSKGPAPAPVWNRY